MARRLRRSPAHWLVLFLLLDRGDSLAGPSSGERRRVAKPKARSSPSQQQQAFEAHKRLNRELIQAPDAASLLKVLQGRPGALTQFAGGKQLNTVNFSTSLHRLARHSLRQRKEILSDPRFALLLASLAELQSEFQPRENSNVGWALAKLQLVPPLSALPKDPSVDLLAEAHTVRERVRQAAAAGDRTPVWIPALSQLAGHLMDAIGTSMMEQEVVIQQELANLLWAWATSQRADAALFGSIVRRMIAFPVVEGELRPQEWSNTVWALATAQVYDGAEALLQHVATLLKDHPEFAPAFKPQELSNTLWATATLLSNKPEPLSPTEMESALTIWRILGKEVVARAGDFKSQELSNSLWAMATIGFGLTSTHETQSNNYLILPSDQVEEDRELMEAILQSVCIAARRILPKFRSQELNNVAWALARLVDHPSESVWDFLAAIGEQLSEQKRFVTSQDVGTTRWSFATMGFYDEDLYRRIAYRFAPTMAPSCKPQELSNAVWAVATAEIVVEEVDAFDTSLVPDQLRPKVRDPIVRLFALAADQLMKRPYAFKTQEVKDILWSFSKVGIRHPVLFRRITEHLVGTVDGNTKCRGLDDFSPQGIGNMAWAFARQAQLASEVADRLGDSSNLAHLSGRLAVYTAAYYDIGEALIQRLFAAIADAGLRVHRDLSKLRPQDMSNTCWTFAVLGLKHTEYMSAAKAQMTERLNRYRRGERNMMTTFKGQELANFIWSVATLDLPSDGILEAAEGYIEEVCGESLKETALLFKRQELANIAWSCSVCGEYPPRLMKIVYKGLMGDDPKALATLYRDGGIQPQAVMTMIYVQTAMDRVDSENPLRLPPNFPEGWGQAWSSSRQQQWVDSCLNLSTSKIQRSVGAAFGRIGYDLVEEYVISMQELATVYGVHVAELPMEILSIDCADPERRIAIEVDGPSHFISSIDGSIVASGYMKNINGKLDYQFGWDGTRQSPNGTTALKKRLLESLGWSVINVPFWEWYSLGGDEDGECAYCESLLAEINR